MPRTYFRETFICLAGMQDSPFVFEIVEWVKEEVSCITVAAECKHLSHGVKSLTCIPSLPALLVGRLCHSPHSPQGQCLQLVSGDAEIQTQTC